MHVLQKQVDNFLDSASSQDAKVPRMATFFFFFFFWSQTQAITYNFSMKLDNYQFNCKILGQKICKTYPKI